MQNRENEYHENEAIYTQEFKSLKCSIITGQKHTKLNIPTKTWITMISHLTTTDNAVMPTLLQKLTIYITHIVLHNT